MSVSGNLNKGLEVTFPNGTVMPLVGLGTYKVEGAALIQEVLDYALKAGYRKIDTAEAYHNEEFIGQALKVLLPKYKLTRKDIFITTKLGPFSHGIPAYQAIVDSLKRLDCQYIDLYLIHWPGVYDVEPSSDENSKKRDISWQQLVKGQKNGLTRNIGVSNYTVRHLKELLLNAHLVRPVVNQVEWHPNWHQTELYNLCKQEQIQLEAYQSLGGTGNKALIENSTVEKTAKKLGKSPAQLLLRWSVQQGVSVIPKARSKARIEENFDLNFTIPEKDMNALSSLPQNKFCWNPENIA